MFGRLRSGVRWCLQCKHRGSEFTLSTKIAAKPDLQQRLVTAALELLGQDGTESISLRAVARSAGVSAMAPYRHFPDKEALLAAVAARGFEALRGELQTADRAAASGSALVAQAVAYVGFAVANPALFRLMFGPPRAGAYPKLRGAGEAAFDVLASRVASEAKPDAREPLTLGCWALVHGMALLFLDGQLAGRTPASPGDVTRGVAEAMLGATIAGQAFDRGAQV